MKEVNIYVSAYVNFLDIGAYGVIIENSGTRREISAYSKPTTERRIRLMGVVAALDSLTESCEVTIHIDSEYVIDCINKGWVDRWELRDWTLRTGQKAKNSDLWEKLIPLLYQQNVNFVLIPEHNGFEYGHEYFQRCEELAKESVKRAR